MNPTLSNMKTPMNRRSFVRLSAATAAALPAALALKPVSAAAQARAVPEAEGVTHYQIGPHIWLRWNNGPLISYRAHPTQKYPYFFPTTGPVSGLSLTSESSLPYPHHRSEVFGCDRVNGGNYWQEELTRGQVLSRGPRVAESTKQSAVILDECDWRQPGQPVQMTDSRKFTVSVRNPRLWLLDAEITWRAEVDVTIQKTNHALFALRAAGDITVWGGGNLVTSEGKSGEKDTFGQPARWCAFYGKRAQAKGEPVEGIALMDHPKNPWAPCPWFTRDYGFCSPTAFNFRPEPWQLAAGKSVQLKHRVAMFAGDPSEAGLDALYAEWSKG